MTFKNSYYKIPTIRWTNRRQKPTFYSSSYIHRKYLEMFLGWWTAGNLLSIPSGARPFMGIFRKQDLTDSVELPWILPLGPHGLIFASKWGTQRLLVMVGAQLSHCWNSLLCRKFSNEVPQTSKSSLPLLLQTSTSRVFMVSKKRLSPLFLLDASCGTDCLEEKVGSRVIIRRRDLHALWPLAPWPRCNSLDAISLAPGCGCSNPILGNSRQGF